MINKLINLIKKYMNEENMSPTPIIEGETVEEKKEIREEPIIRDAEMGMSPTPKKVKEMNFPDALREVIAGKKITKLKWCNKEVVVLLEKEILTLYKDDGKPYQLILSEGDIKGEDWVLIED